MATEVYALYEYVCQGRRPHAIGAEHALKMCPRAGCGAEPTRVGNGSRKEKDDARPGL